MSSQTNHTSAKVLRIGLFQNNRIIEERLLREPKPVTIGSSLKKNMFVVPASNLPQNMTVFEVRNGRYTLNISKEMTGRVKIGAGIQTLQDLIQSGKAKKGQAGYTIDLEPTAQGRLAIGEATLLFQFVTPPPPRPKPVLPASMRGGWMQAMGMIFVTAMAMSAILHVGPVAYLVNTDFPEQLEMEQQINDRFVKIMLNEEEPEIPEPEPETPTEVADGAPTEADPEPAPKPKDKVAAKDPEPKDDAKKPKSADDIAREEAARKKRLAVEVQNKTILGQIGAISADGSSGSLKDVLSGGAGKTSMDDAFKGSKGITTGKLGAEKSGMRSSGGSGADGKGAKVGIGELKGTSGAKTASKGVKTGTVKAVKIKSRVNIKGPTRTIGGTLDTNSLTKTLGRKKADFQKCYNRELKKNQKARGKVIVMFVVGQRGRVTSAKANVDSVGGGVGACVAGVIKRLRFPPPKGGPATVNKTFVFDAG